MIKIDPRCDVAAPHGCFSLSLTIMSAPNAAILFIATRLADSNLSPTFTDLFALNQNAAVDIFAKFYASCPQMTIKPVQLQTAPDKSNLAAYMLWQSSQKSFGRTLSGWFKQSGGELDTVADTALKSLQQPVRLLTLIKGSYSGIS